MLVLSRKHDESIVIGDNVVVTVLSIQGDKVRLGIDAPREMPVHRQEVRERIQNRDGPMPGIPVRVHLPFHSHAVTR